MGAVIDANAAFKKINEYIEIGKKEGKAAPRRHARSRVDGYLHPADHHRTASPPTPASPRRRFSARSSQSSRLQGPSMTGLEIANGTDLRPDRRPLLQGPPPPRAGPSRAPRRQPVFQPQVHRRPRRRPALRRFQHVRHRQQSRRPRLPPALHAGQEHHRAAVMRGTPRRRTSWK